MNDAINKYQSLTGGDCVVFYENLSLSLLSGPYSLMNIQKAYQYTETIIATDLSSARLLINFPGAKRKIFYVYDLEWVFMEPKEFKPLAQIYRNDAFEIVCRGNSHAGIFKSCWNREPDRVSNEFDISGILGT